MHYPTLFRAAVVAFSLFAGCAAGLAQDNVMKPAAPAAAAPLHFASLDGLDLKAILPAPPAPGSLAAAAEVETILQVQAWRTPEQVEWAKLVDKGEYFAAFAADGLLGPKFSRDNCPALAALFKDLLADQRAVMDAYKKIFPRPRPFLADARVEPIAEKSTSGSYPSGHGVLAYEWAAVLAEVYPEKRAEVLERGRRTAWGRVLGGVHFPTDLEGGRRFAEAVIAAELKNAAFQAALEKCRAEAAALQPVAGPRPDASAPIAKKDTGAFLKRHEGFLARGKEGLIGVLFLGDSITDGWARAPHIWERHYGKYQPANFGIGGDTTQNVIWRIEHGELDGLTPKVVVLMLGTNNSGSHTAAEIAAADKKIVGLIRAKIPAAKVLLLAIFPRGERKNRDGSVDTGIEKMAVIRAVNAELATLDDGKDVRFLDIGAAFLGEDGKIPLIIMPDRLHPNVAGYQLWADAMQARLDEMMK